MAAQTNGVVPESEFVVLFSAFDVAPPPASVSRTNNLESKKKPNEGQFLASSWWSFLI
jgi:hypothetical protein